MAIIARRTFVKNGQLIVEEINDIELQTFRPKKKMKGGDFVFVFQKAIREVVENANLSKNAYKILLWLLAETEFEKEINITLYKIAKKLRMNQGNAATAMKILENISIVIRNRELRTFRLNYEIAFKGSPKNYKKLQFKDNPVLSDVKPGEPRQSNIFGGYDKITEE